MPWRDGGLGHFWVPSLRPSSTAQARVPGSSVVRPWHAKWLHWDAFVSEAGCPLHPNGSLAHPLLREGTAPLGDVCLIPGDPTRADRKCSEASSLGTCAGPRRVPLPAAPSLAVLRLGPRSRGPGTPAAPQRLNPEEAGEGRSAGARRRTGSARGAGSSAGRSAGRSQSAGARGAPPAPSFVWRGRGGAGSRRVPIPAPAPAPAWSSGSFPARWQPRPPSTLRVSSGRASGRA